MAPHEDMDMGGATAAAATDHTHSSAESSEHTGMMMTFFMSTSTPLFSEKWTPDGAGAYAATCVFLAVLAVILRLLLAGRSVLEAHWLDRELARRYVIVAGRQGLGARLSSESIDKRALTLSENGVEESVTVVQRKVGAIPRPWRLSVDPVRAVFDVVIAGVGYLLMLAVMTMNVGYFLSALAGIFIGSLAVGRFTASSEH